MKRALSNILFTCLLSTLTLAQTTEFTYQGNLINNATPATGNYEFEFLLFDSQNGGAQVGPTLLRNAVVSNGTFTVKLDFGAVFPGAERYLEIHVRQQGQPAYTPLSPRQLLNSTPYAVKAVNATQLGGITADQFVLTGDSRMTDARNPLPGSANYVQNTMLQQPNTNFNISGVGTAGSFNSLTQFNIAGDRVLGIQGINNTFLGVGTGAANASGSGNAFFGFGSGDANSTGGFNSFFGRNAGGSNVSGSFNSYFGEGSGPSSTSSNNSFFGSNTGFNNTTGNNLTLIGQNANVTADGLSNATAIGFRAAVGQSNSLVLGSINGVNTAVADTNVGIGTTTPIERLHVVGNGLFTGNLTVNGQFSGTVTNAQTATNALQLGGVAANQFVQTNDARLSDARNPLPGSTSYIQNQNAGPQALSNFNISGDGVIAGNMTIGSGSSGGRLTVATPSGQAIFGSSLNGIGIQGFSANGPGILGSSTTGTGVYGTSTSGTGVSGFSQSNIAVYGESPQGTAGYFNGRVFVFRDSNAASDFQSSQFRIRGLTNNLRELALGFDTTANVGAVQAYEVLVGPRPLALNPNGGGVGVGTSTPSDTLQVMGTGRFTKTNGASTVAINSTVGTAALFLDRGTVSPSSSADIRFYSAGQPDFVIGTSEGNAAPTDLTIYNYGNSSNVLTIQRSNGFVGIGTNSPTSKLHVNGGLFAVTGTFASVQTDSLSIAQPSAPGGGGSPLCGIGPIPVQVGFCSSSSLRYKTNIDTFRPGLSLIRQLRPITFDWRSDGSHDFGLGAEEVEAVAPQLVFYRNNKIEGVRYDRIGVVLINAVKEQQAQIEAQQEQSTKQQAQIESLRAEVEMLKQLVCASNPTAIVCRK